MKMTKIFIKSYEKKYLHEQTKNNQKVSIFFFIEP